MQQETRGSMPPSDTYQPECIVLTGFMGAGKTTIGRELSKRLRWKFTDLDTAVEQQTGKRVAEIFALYGEATFRLLEAETLATQLRDRYQVIALGGGAPGTAGVRHQLRESPRTAIVYLHASFDILYRRCREQALDASVPLRPLLGERAVVEARYLDRMPLYAALATHTIDVTSGGPEDVVTALLRTLQFEEMPPS